MKIVRFMKSYINFIFIGLLLFIVGSLCGSYITNHSNNLAAFLIYQRTNISIAIFTGIISGIVVSSYFDIMQKRIETKEYIRILISHLMLIRQGIDDLFEREMHNLLEDYLIKDNMLNIGFEKYKKYMDKKTMIVINNALKFRSDSELAYRNIKTYTNAIAKSFKLKTIHNKSMETYIQDYQSKILEKKNMLLENRDKIDQLILKIHELTNNQ